MKNNIDSQKGIYIHIPFCSNMCLSCEFNENYQNINLINRYIDALVKEFNDIDRDDKIITVYIGGGMPSILNEKQLSKLLMNLHEKIDLTGVEEFTIEARVEDLNIEKINILKEYGVNRVSLFVQEIDSNLEYLLGPGANELEVRKTIKNLLNEGIDNISADLMFGLPNQGIKELEKSLNKLISYDVNHVSIYSMTLDERVVEIENRNDIQIADNQLEIDMYGVIRDYLSNHGFEHYELSSFSKQKRIAIHNSNYWKNIDYYGFGAGAHGKLKGIRYSNTMDTLGYIEKIENFITPKEEEIILSLEEKIEEEFYLGLQMLEGIDLDKIDNKYNIDSKRIYSKALEKHIKKGDLILENNILKLNTNSISKFIEISADFLF